MQNLLISCIFLLALASCSQQEAHTVVLEEGLDTLSLQTPYIENLELRQGSLPEGWKETEIGEHVSIAFPRKARSSKHKKLKRTDWTYKRRDYLMNLSRTDLRKDSSFLALRQYKQDYYEALLEDLRQGLYEEQRPARLEEKHFFFFADSLEGLRANLRAEDVYLFLQALLIDEELYTASVLFWKEPDSALLQTKDRFFYSFAYKADSLAEQGN